MYDVFYLTAEIDWVQVKKQSVQMHYVDSQALVLQERSS
jgi:hypothetical protein